MKLQSKILFLEHLLLEALNKNVTRAINSIAKRRVMKIFYSPPHDNIKNRLRGVREFEPYAIGINKWGNTVIYGYLRNDFSATLNKVGKDGKVRPNDAIRWRMFRIDGILDFKYTKEVFDINVSKPKLNKLFNKALKPLPGDRAVRTVFNPKGRVVARPEDFETEEGEGEEQ